MYDVIEYTALSGNSESKVASRWSSSGDALESFDVNSGLERDDNVNDPSEKESDSVVGSSLLALCSSDLSVLFSLAIIFLYP